MLKRIDHPGIEQGVRALAPRYRDSLLTDTQRNYVLDSRGALVLGVFRSIIAFFALLYLPMEEYSTEVLSGLIHFMGALWLLGYSFQLAATIREQLDGSDLTSFLTILPASGAARADAILRDQFFFLVALPVELFVWHTAAALALGQPILSAFSLVSLGMAALMVVSLAVLLLRFASRVPDLTASLNTACGLFLFFGFIEGIVKKKFPLSFGVEDIVRFIGEHLAFIGDVIPIGWFFQPSVGKLIHPLQWATGIAIVGGAVFLFKAVHDKLVSRTERQISALDEIDLDLLLLREGDLDDYFELLGEPDELPTETEAVPAIAIGKALARPSPESVLPGRSLEHRLIRRTLDAEECAIMDAFHDPPAPARAYLIRAWIFIGIVVAGQFLATLSIPEFWIIFLQMGCSVLAILSLCRSGSGLRAAYSETGVRGNTITTAVLFPVSIQRLSALRMKLACTFSLIHLPPALFVIGVYWLCHFDSSGISQILIGGFSFAIFGASAFLIVQWFTTATLLLKMGRSFLDLTRCASLVLFVSLNFTWCLVIAAFFAFEFKESWVVFIILGTSQAAVCAFTYHIGLRRLVNPTVDLCGKEEKSFTLT